MQELQLRLNPYCSGRWSRTYATCKARRVAWTILILIVVEDGLVQSYLQEFL